MAKWLTGRFTNLWQMCVSQGHQPYVHSAGFGKVHLFCEECDGFWRIEARSLAWMARQYWPGKPPARRVDPTEGREQ